MNKPKKWDFTTERSPLSEETAGMLHLLWAIFHNKEDMDCGLGFSDENIETVNDFCKEQNIPLAPPKDRRIEVWTV